MGAAYFLCRKETPIISHRFNFGGSGGMEFFERLLAQLGVPQQWIIIIIVALFSFWLGVKWKGTNDEGEIRALRAQTALAKDQHEKLLTQSSETEKKIADVKVEIADLRRAVAERAPMVAVNQIFDRLDSDTGDIATSNSTTQKIAKALLGASQSDAAKALRSASFRLTRRSDE